ncbi:MAG: hypothetical protein ACREVA_13480, partial [Burkholderiales bacterium]
WSTLSTQTALTHNFNGLTTGKGVALASSNAFSGNLLDAAASGLSSGNNISSSISSAASSGTTLFLSNNAGAGNVIRADDSTGDTTPFVVNINGSVGIRDATPDLTLEVSGTSDTQFGLSDTGTAHGITALTDTDVFFQVLEQLASTGGTLIRGFINSGSFTPLRLTGYFGSTNPTDTIPAVIIAGGRRSGTSSVNLDALETTFAVMGSLATTNLFNVLDGGNIGINNNAPTAKLDLIGDSKFTNTSTALTGTADAFLASGDNAANTGNLIKATVSGTSAATIPIMATNAGTGLSLRVNDDGTDTDSTPFVINAAGSVGIGTGVPISRLHIYNVTAGDAFAAMGDGIVTAGEC